MGKFPSVMSHSFSMVPKVDIPRSVFNRSHCFKTTFDADYLIPFLVDEALPGDSWNVDASLFARLNTPLSPVMDNMYLDVFFFSVPYRLVWANWKNFMGERVDPDDDPSTYLVPHMHAPASTGIAEQSLSDYFGLPTKIPDYQFNSLFHRAYNLIYNEWFRDQNLIDSVKVDTGAGPDTYTDYVLLKRCKKHDYFTSCLTAPQKGTVSSISLTGNAPVLGIGKGNQTFASGPQTVYESNGASRAYANYAMISDGQVNDYFFVEKNTSTAYPNVYASLANISALTINDLREAFAVQTVLERDARGGTRYCEIVQSHFGVTDPEHAVLQRPEYLGGSSTPVVITPVPQTAPKPATGTTTVQGNLAGFGTVSCTGAGFTKSFTEHCLIMGILNVRADITYQQGLNRMFSRQTRYDFYLPALANLGEQEVLMKELYCQDPATDTGSTGIADNERVFGYQERWAEYRYKPSLITGKLRSTCSTSLDNWHLSEEFSALPALDDTFITSNTPIDRVVAVTTEPDFTLDSFIKMIVARPMPVFSVPGAMGRF